MLCSFGGRRRRRHEDGKCGIEQHVIELRVNLLQLRGIGLDGRVRTNCAYNGWVKPELLPSGSDRRLELSIVAGSRLGRVEVAQHPPTLPQVAGSSSLMLNFVADRGGLP
jgi:hypothetical protein